MENIRSVIVTGGAGFIGSHLVDELLGDGVEVTVIDNFDPFYDRAIKKNNQSRHFDYHNFKFLELDIRDDNALNRMLKDDYQMIIHLAAKAGVRPSLKNPVIYQDVNLWGTQNLLELTKERKIPHFIFASSSSVYGINPNVPWKEDHDVLRPISPYASTKVSGELLGHVYSHIYGIQFIALRFFTVYGPRQRPDLAIHKFTRNILQGLEIPVFGDGSSRRDYTYVADIVKGIKSAMQYKNSLFDIFNIGNNKTVSLSYLIKAIEETLGKPARLHFMDTQPGDVPQTYADISKAREHLNYQPATDLHEGLMHFRDWLQQVSIY